MGAHVMLVFVCQASIELLREGNLDDLKQQVQEENERADTLVAMVSMLQMDWHVGRQQHTYMNVDTFHVS